MLGIQGKVNTVCHSEQSLANYDTNFDAMSDIAWTVKVMSNLLKDLNKALRGKMITTAYHPLPETVKIFNNENRL